MKKLILLICSFLILAGCNDKIRGMLELPIGATFKFQGKGKKTVDAGQYDVEVSQNINDGYLNIEFQNLWGNSDPDVRFYYGENVKIPEDNGQFYIEAGESGQGIGLKGNVETTIDREKNMRREMERCQARVRRQECSGGGRGGPVCTIRETKRPGERAVEFTLETRTKTIVVDLFNLNFEMIGEFKRQLRNRGCLLHSDG